MVQISLHRCTAQANVHTSSIFSPKNAPTRTCCPPSTALPALGMARTCLHPHPSSRRPCASSPTFTWVSICSTDEAILHAYLRQIFLARVERTLRIEKREAVRLRCDEHRIQLVLGELRNRVRERHRVVRGNAPIDLAGVDLQTRNTSEPR